LRILIGAGSSLVRAIPLLFLSTRSLWILMRGILPTRFLSLVLVPVLIWIVSHEISFYCRGDRVGNVANAVLTSDRDKHWVFAANPADPRGVTGYG